MRVVSYTGRVTAGAVGGFAVVLGMTGCGSSGSAGASAKVTSAVPFPVAVGNTWTYKTTGTRGSKTVTTGTQTDKVTAVAPGPGGQKVTFMVTQVTGGVPVRSGVYYTFGANGAITASAYFTPSATGQPEGGAPSAGYLKFPSTADLASGKPETQSLTEPVQIGTGTHQETNRITIQGKGTGTVTVPAGTYQAVIVTETQTISVVGGHNTMTARTTTWLAPGVGPVKELVSLQIGRVSGLTTVELKSFSKG